MHREFDCPSCGAANVVTNPGVLMKVCDYCKTAMYWDKDSALRAGIKSQDLPPSSRFKIGAAGKLKDQSFTVLGRLRYAHENGTWDEWFVETGDGKILWLTEDEGELFLEKPLQLTSEVPPHADLRPGMQIQLNDKVGVVEEVGEARCIGGEGQIPFIVEIGETYPYADGASPDGNFSFGLEYDTRTGQPSAFIGTILKTKEVKSRKEDREAPEARVGEIIRCPSCGKPYEGPKAKTTEMVVCAACGSGLQLDEAETRVVGKNQGRTPGFTFKVGDSLTLEGVRWEIMGRLYYVEVDEGIEYGSFEYVLYTPESGYLWLSEEKGHFTLNRVTHGLMRLPPFPVPRQTVRVGADTFRIFETGEMTLRWVDGALPWVASVGEKTRYTHLIKPPECLDQEVTGKEVESFRGRYVSHEELQAAIPKDIKLPSPRGVYSCQPYVAGPSVAGMWKVGVAFLAINLMLLLYSLVAGVETTVLEGQITAEQYTKEQLTASFQVPRNESIMQLIGSAPVDNSWLAVDFALVNGDDQVVSEMFGEASYYHGTDSEGSWSEGSRHFGSYFMVDKAGAYRLLIHGQGGSGEGGKSRDEPVTFRVTAGNTISWYFIFPILFSALAALIQPISRGLFEARRWPSSDDGDDGDDD